METGTLKSGRVEKAAAMRGASVFPAEWGRLSAVPFPRSVRVGSSPTCGNTRHTSGCSVARRSRQSRLPFTSGSGIYS